MNKYPDREDALNRAMEALPCETIKSILESCNHEIAVYQGGDFKLSPDYDPNLDDMIGPQQITKITFSINYAILPNGGQWIAKEKSRTYPADFPTLGESYQERILKELLEKEGLEYEHNDMTAEDTCDFVPYEFTMFSEFDSTTERGRELKHWFDIGRLRSARRLARQLGKELPKSVDDKLVDEIKPDLNVYNPDGTIDRVAEFERLKRKIETGVKNKTLQPMNEKPYMESTDSVIRGGKVHTLESCGKIRIEYDPDVNGACFIIDDVKVSLEQFANLVSSYEGFEMYYQMADAQR